MKRLQREGERERERDRGRDREGERCSDTNSFSADSPSPHDSYEIPTPPRPTMFLRKKKILHTKQVLTDKTCLFPAALKLSFQFFSVSDTLSHCKGKVSVLL